MRGAQVFFNPAKVNHRCGSGGAVMLAFHLATEGMMLQVEEPRSALDVGQRFRPGHLLPLEHLAAAQCPLELPHELFQVMLDHPVQVHQLTVYIVQHFAVGTAMAQEVQRGATTEQLHIAVVLGEQREKFVSQTALAAQPGDDRIRIHRCVLGLALAGALSLKSD